VLPPGSEREGINGKGLTLTCNDAVFVGSFTEIADTIAFSTAGLSAGAGAT